jgi:predicted dehydrogenase
MPELARRFYPATLRLRAVLESHLGRPRLILGQTRSYGYERYGQPGPSVQIEPTSLTIDPGSYLIDWCRSLLGPSPLHVSGFAAPILKPDDPNPDFLTFTLNSREGAVAQISVNRYHRAVWGEPSRVLPSAGFQIYAERGIAWLEMPDRILWSHADGVHDERLPMEPTVGEQLNLHFHRMLSGEPHLAPSLEDALAVARLVHQLEDVLQATHQTEPPPSPPTDNA